MTPSLRRLDFAILDRVYTPVAHWLHDLAGLRSHQLAKACIAGMAAALPLFRSPLWLEALGAVAIAIIFFVEMFWKPIAKIGCDNVRRYSDQVSRIMNWLFFLADALTSHQYAPMAIWWLSLISVFYFGAVRERPRKPKIAAVAAAAAA